MTAQHTTRQRTSRPPWQRRVVSGAVALGVAVVLWLIGAAVIPRWWAQRVANVVDGSLTLGALYGFFIGSVFTVLPLLAIWLAVRLRGTRRSWRGWLAWLVVAAVLAAPNLMTLGIVWGSGDAAHDGDRILSVDANGFRLWSFIGALTGAAAVAILAYLVRTRGWFRDQNRRLRSDLADRPADRA